jgi:2-dehydropantoate 2-reductase
MRTLLVGCGAIGGVVAAMLARAGHDVTVVTGNQEIRDAVAARGLRVRELDGSEWAVQLRRPPVVAAAELGGEAPYDLCLLSTKTTTLEEAVRGVMDGGLLQEGANVVCLQNGLPEDRVVPLVSPRGIGVIGCVVGWGASLIEPGLSARTSTGSFQMGRPLALPGGRAGTDAGAGAQGGDRSVQEVATFLHGAGMPARIVDNLPGVRWSKLAINCATSTLGAAGGDTLGRLLRRRFVRRLALEIFSEVSAVARAAGVRMTKVAGTLDIDRLALTEEERRLRVGSAGLLLKHSVLYLVGLKFRRMRSSMLIAIERGRRPEIDWLNGEVARRGAALGVHTPVNAGLVGLIHEIVGQRARPGVETLRAFHDRALLPAGEIGTLPA